MLNSSVKNELNSRSVEELLDSLSLDIMKDNIKQQVYGELDSQRDFLDTVLNKFNFIISNGDFDDDTRETLTTEIHDFCNEVIDYIVHRYDLMYEEYPSSITEVTQTLYQFFVIRKEFNVKDFLISYIEENKHEIVEILSLDSGLDIMSIASSYKTDDKDNIKIISNVDAVIRHILSLGISTEEFLDVLCCEGEYYTQQLQEFVESDMINGNFVSNYLSDVIDDYDSIFSTDIRNEIRIHFGLK